MWTICNARNFKSWACNQSVDAAMQLGKRQKAKALQLNTLWGGDVVTRSRRFDIFSRAATASTCPMPGPASCCCRLERCSNKHLLLCFFSGSSCNTGGVLTCLHLKFNRQGWTLINPFLGLNVFWCLRKRVAQESTTVNTKAKPNLFRRNHFRPWVSLLCSFWSARSFSSFALRIARHYCRRSSTTSLPLRLVQMVENKNAAVIFYD